MRAYWLLPILNKESSILCFLKAGLFSVQASANSREQNSSQNHTYPHMPLTLCKVSEAHNLLTQNIYGIASSVFFFEIWLAQCAGIRDEQTTLKSYLSDWLYVYYNNIEYYGTSLCVLVSCIVHIVHSLIILEQHFLRFFNNCYCIQLSYMEMKFCERDRKIFHHAHSLIMQSFQYIIYTILSSQC